MHRSISFVGITTILFLSFLLIVSQACRALGGESQGAALYLEGNNSRAAGAVESHREWFSGRPDHALSGAFSSLEAGGSKEEIAGKARGLTPHGTTLLGPMAVSRFDMLQEALFSKLKQTIVRAKLKDPLSFAADRLINQTERPDVLRVDDRNPLAEREWERFRNSVARESVSAEPEMSRTLLLSSQWNAWLTPLDGHERYEAKSASFADASGVSIGGNFGLARHFGNYSFGLSVFLMRGEPSGGGWLAEVESYGFMAGLRAKTLNLGPLKPWLEIAAGWSHSAIRQSRTDILGASHESSPNQEAFRFGVTLGQSVALFPGLSFSPVIGLDYTSVHLGGYSEEGDDLALKVRGAAMRSVRSKVGGTLQVGFLENLHLQAHAFLRQEFGDGRMLLDSTIGDSPVSFRTAGERYKRLSGNSGIAFLWQAMEGLSLKAHYDIVLGDRYPGYYAYKPVSVGLEGDSYDSAVGNGGVALLWQVDRAVSLTARYDALLDSQEQESWIDAVIKWNF